MSCLAQNDNIAIAKQVGLRDHNSDEELGRGCVAFKCYVAIAEMPGWINKRKM